MPKDSWRRLNKAEQWFLELIKLSIKASGNGSPVLKWCERRCNTGFCQVHCSINYAMIHCPRTTCDGVSTKSVSSQNDPKEQIRWSLHITWMRCPNSWNKVLTSSWEIVEGISAVEGGKLQIMHATGNYK